MRQYYLMQTEFCRLPENGEGHFCRSPKSGAKKVAESRFVLHRYWLLLQRPFCHDDRGLREVALARYCTTWFITAYLEIYFLTSHHLPRLFPHLLPTLVLYAASHVYTRPLATPQVAPWSNPTVSVCFNLTCNNTFIIIATLSSQLALQKLPTAHATLIGLSSALINPHHASWTTAVL